MLNPTDVDAWLAEIELCDNIDSLDRVREKVMELDCDVGGWGVQFHPRIVGALVAQREKLQPPRWQAWEETGMAVANMASIKKLELVTANNAKEADLESYVVKEGHKLWTSSSSKHGWRR